MSLTSVQQHITHAIADGRVTTAEANTIISRQDGWFSAPKSVGTRVDKQEYAAVKDVFERIDQGHLAASGEARATLDNFVRKGPTDAASHKMGANPVGQQIVKGLTVAGAVGGTAMGLSVGVPTVLASATFLGVLGALGATFIAIGAAAFCMSFAGKVFGHAAAVVHGHLDD